MCLFFKQRVGSTGAHDSNFGPKQGGGDNEKNLKQAAETRRVNKLWQD